MTSHPPATQRFPLTNNQINQITLPSFSTLIQSIQERRTPHLIADNISDSVLAARQLCQIKYQPQNQTQHQIPAYGPYLQVNSFPNTNDITSLQVLENNVFTGLLDLYYRAIFTSIGVGELQASFENKLCQNVTYGDDVIYTINADSSVAMMTKSNFREFINSFPANLSDNYNVNANLGTLSTLINTLKYRYAATSSISHLTNSDDIDRDSDRIIVSNPLPSNDISSNASTKSPSQSSKRKGGKREKKKVIRPKRKYTRKKTVDVCVHCKCVDTPEWRKGPPGSGPLCNACGLFYTKLVKKFEFDDALAIFNHRKSSGEVNNRIIPTHEEKEDILQKIVSSTVKIESSIV
ncbi:uncharacterized protein RJT21DRAFT_126595 [Scheffersomyces amazonensis]|uniref:uncharacterized protein n=1 Tax=Scheffersomyces amazonensis TaxID=1078765 RepID=UPI00315C693C